MDLLKLITNARTCRRYVESKELEPGTLPWLIECARLSPSAGNQQPLRYLTVSTPAKRAAFFPSLVWAASLPEWPGPAEGERPTGYIVVLAPKAEDGKIGRFTYMDVGIACQSIQLAASTKGIGVCMFGSFKPQLIREVLPVPEDYEIMLCLALGHELEERHVAPVPADGNVKYYRDDKGVH
ncbi:nitroreductase family protein, partial [Desulfovibrio sp. OttesenSCG-928-C06]|nr:nitroreductase family protein [Desulfovibrio sp. OttesenSCG-928-C06]MDL2307781.1 nitroreductase family protein [Desulfovibrio sp. OttesenSCG-928-C06]